MQEGERGPDKVLPGLWQGKAEVHGHGMGRRRRTEQNADGGVDGVDAGVGRGDEGIQGGVEGGEGGGREGLEEYRQVQPRMVLDSCHGCDRLYGVVGRVPARGDGPGVPGVVVGRWTVVGVSEGED